MRSLSSLKDRQVGNHSLEWIIGDAMGGPLRLKYIKLEYEKHFVSDPRYYRAAGHYFDKATSARPRPEHDALYFCLP